MNIRYPIYEGVYRILTEQLPGCVGLFGRKQIGDRFRLQTQERLRGIPYGYVEPAASLSA